MDRRKLHERIAETLEPKPTTKPRGLGRNRGPWIYSDELPVDDDTEIGWYAFNPDTDETANALLRDAMLSKITIHEWYERLTNEALLLGWVMIYSPEKYRLAQVEAYARWKGLADER